MTISFDDGYIIFSSGRKMYANGHIVGMNAEGDVSVSEGWDDGINYQSELANKLKDKNALTKADFIELGDLMIERWKTFKQTVINS